MASARAERTNERVAAVEVDEVVDATGPAGATRGRPPADWSDRPCVVVPWLRTSSDERAAATVAVDVARAAADWTGDGARETAAVPPPARADARMTRGDSLEVLDREGEALDRGAADSDVEASNSSSASEATSAASSTMRRPDIPRLRRSIRPAAAGWERVEAANVDEYPCVPAERALGLPSAIKGARPVGDAECRTSVGRGRRGTKERLRSSG